MQRSDRCTLRFMILRRFLEQDDVRRIGTASVEIVLWIIDFAIVCDRHDANGDPFISSST